MASTRRSGGCWEGHQVLLACPLRLVCTMLGGRLPLVRARACGWIAGLLADAAEH